MDNTLRFQNQDPPVQTMCERYGDLYESTDHRSEFYRDYTRILHSTAYRRLKHKTQVFYNTNNDHICTRIEHVNHVDSVSYSIASGLGLDTELTKAIACGHDLGHAPFGHYGEVVIDKLLKENLSKETVSRILPDGQGKIFWHERNGLRFVDLIELLPDRDGHERNLMLTYAVRDGIISHCGELDQKGIMRRREQIDLMKDFDQAGKYEPYTWEGCVVKVSDKIAYLGRDIEDARALGFIGEDELDELRMLSREHMGTETVNTTALMHTLIRDIIENSTPDVGICLSDEKHDLMTRIKKFNYEHIYLSSKFDYYKEYVNLILRQLFGFLNKLYDGRNTLVNIGRTENSKNYPLLTRYFGDWLKKYCSADIAGTNDDLWNTKIYNDLSDRDDHVWAIADFISGMTDQFAISLFDELITFGEKY